MEGTGGNAFKNIYISKTFDFTKNSKTKINQKFAGKALYTCFKPLFSCHIG